MVYTYKELKEKYGLFYQIHKAVKDGILYKVELGIFVKKYSNTLIYGDSTYYHNLILLPKKIFMITLIQ